MNRLKHNANCSENCRYQGHTFTAPSEIYEIQPTLAIEWACAPDVLAGLDSGDIIVLDVNDADLSMLDGLEQLRNPQYWF